MNRSKIIMVTIIVVITLLLIYSPLKKGFIGTEQNIEITYSYVDGEISKESETIESNNTMTPFWE